MENSEKDEMENSEKDEMENSEKEICAAVTKMEEGEGERRIYVAQTAISRVGSTRKSFTDKQGQTSIEIRSPSTKRAGHHTQVVQTGSDGKGLQTELNEDSSGRETPSISQIDDGENEQ
ncbi:hypothetical protein R3I93_002505 [Phoxinus phoxinus]|uniref:Uncharacterized protein n=1 Tax=Phoxinus phoxinus TaxID=58324 RepID=A0AAN9HHD9_9TELE